jgi:Co/Zn/Cd efflux system component
MSASCCEHETPKPQSLQNLPRYRRVLWAALWLNALMFGVELIAAHRSGSLSLVADAVDFAADAMNYGISLAVLGSVLLVRAKAALFKAACMAALGLYVWVGAAWQWSQTDVPHAATMGVVGVMALAVNVAVAALLYAFREGDANMRSVWLCSRNDAIGNLAVVAAALGVFGTHQAWPDLLVATLMATLALRGAWVIARQARVELKQAPGGHAH